MVFFLILVGMLASFFVGLWAGWSMGREYGYEAGHKDGWRQHAQYIGTPTFKESRRRTS